MPTYSHINKVKFFWDKDDAVDNLDNCHPVNKFKFTTSPHAPISDVKDSLQKLANSIGHD